MKAEVSIETSWSCIPHKKGLPHPSEAFLLRKQYLDLDDDNTVSSYSPFFHAVLLACSSAQECRLLIFCRFYGDDE